MPRVGPETRPRHRTGTPRNLPRICSDWAKLGSPQPRWLYGTGLDSKIGSEYHMRSRATASRPPSSSVDSDAVHITHEDLSDALASVQFRAGKRRPTRLLAIGAAALAVLAFGAAAIAVVEKRAAAAPDHAAVNVPTVQTIDENGWRFTVHLPTGAEALFELATDPNCRKNLIRTERERGADLRTKLLKRCGVASMTELREPHRELTDTLRRLGYL